MRKGRFLLTTFVLLAVILGAGLNVVAAQEPVGIEFAAISKPIPNGGHSSNDPPNGGLVTDPALMPPGPPPAKRPDGTPYVPPNGGESVLTGNIEPNASGRLIREADGHIFWDGPNDWLHAHAWTVAFTNYRNVEHWIWWWDGSNWVQIGWKKEESDSLNRVDVVSNLVCGFALNTGWHTQTSRHHARNNIFDQETIEITDYPHVWVNCN